MIKILAFILLLLGAMPLSQAQTLEEYLVEAGKNSPALKARYAEYQAALQRAPQVGALPDPEASFNFFLRPMERYMGNQVGDISVMQMFPWFGANKAAKNEANAMAQMKFASFVEAKINLYHEVRTVWYQLYLNDQESILMEKELEMMQTLERLALARYTSAPAGGASGAATPARGTKGGARTSSSGAASSGSSGMAGMGGSGGGTASGGGMASGGSGMAGMGGGTGGSSMVDVLLIRLQVRELENQMRIHHEARRPLQLKFNQLLRRRPSMTVISADTLLPAALPATLSLIEDSIRSNHPMLKMYEWDEKARESQLRMARLMGRPMFGVGMNYMIFTPRTDAMMGEMSGGNMLMPMVSLSLPIYRKKYDAASKEAEFSQQAATFQKEATERELFTELENLLYQYQSSVSRINLLRDQVTLTEQAIRLLTTSYSVTGAGIEDIIRQRQSLLSYRQQQVQAISDQHIAVSGISRMMQGDN